MKIFWLARIINDRYKKYSRNYYISITLASILILFFISISNSINIVYNSMAEENYYIKQITLESFLVDEGNKYTKNDIDNNTIDIIVANDYVDQISVKHQLSHSDTINISHNNYIIPIDSLIKGTDPKYSTFSKTEINIIREEYGSNNNVILAGRNFQEGDTNSTLIDENLVYILGYDNVNDIIGKKIKITSFRLKNLPQSDYDDIRKTGWANPLILSMDVISSFSKEINNDRFMFSGQKEIILDVKSVRNVEDVYNLIDKYTDNLINSSLQESKKTIIQLDNISIFALVISSIILIISFISIVNGCISKIYIQRKFLKMMLVIGYSIMDIVKVYILDNIITFFKSAITFISFIYIITFIIEVNLKPYYTVMATNLNNTFIANFYTVSVYTLTLFILTTLITFISTFNQVKKHLDMRRF